MRKNETFFCLTSLFKQENGNYILKKKIDRSAWSRLHYLTGVKTQYVKLGSILQQRFKIIHYAIHKSKP